MICCAKDAYDEEIQLQGAVIYPWHISGSGLETASGNMKGHLTLEAACGYG